MVECRLRITSNVTGLPNSKTSEPRSTAGYPEAISFYMSVSWLMAPGRGLLVDEIQPSG